MTLIDEKGGTEFKTPSELFIHCKDSYLASFYQTFLVKYSYLKKNNEDRI